MKLAITIIIGLTLGFLLAEYDTYLKIQDKAYYNYYTHQDEPPANLFHKTRDHPGRLQIPLPPRLPKIEDLIQVFESEGIEYSIQDLRLMGYDISHTIN